MKQRITALLVVLAMVSAVVISAVAEEPVQENGEATTISVVETEENAQETAAAEKAAAKKVAKPKTTTAKTTVKAEPKKEEKPTTRITGTSTAAPATLPESSASRRSCSLINPPRAVFTSSTPSFMRGMVSRLMISALSAVSGQCREMTSLFAKRTSSGTHPSPPEGR